LPRRAGGKAPAYCHARHAKVTRTVYTAQSRQFADAIDCTALPATLHALHEHGAAITLIDTPPSVHAFVTDYLMNADFVLIPVKASPHDLASVSDTLALVHQAGVPFAFVLNQAKPNTKMLTEALTALSEHGPIAKPVIHDRSEFAASAVQGYAVTETAPKAKAGQEAKELCSYLLNKLYDGPATDAKES